MQISEMIKELQAMKREYGDLEVAVLDCSAWADAQELCPAEFSFVLGPPDVSGNPVGLMFLNQDVADFISDLHEEELDGEAETPTPRALQLIEGGKKFDA